MQARKSEQAGMGPGLSRAPRGGGGGGAGRGVEGGQREPVGWTYYGQPRSIGGGEISPQSPGAHLWVHTDRAGVGGDGGWGREESE